MTEETKLADLDMYGVDDDGVYHPPSRAYYLELMAEIGRLESLHRATRDFVEEADLIGIGPKPRMQATAGHLVGFIDTWRERFVRLLA